MTEKAGLHYVWMSVGLAASRMVYNRLSGNTGTSCESKGGCLGSQIDAFSSVVYLALPTSFLSYCTKCPLPWWCPIRGNSNLCLKYQRKAIPLYRLKCINNSYHNVSDVEQTRVNLPDSITEYLRGQSQEWTNGKATIILYNLGTVEIDTYIQGLHIVQHTERYWKCPLM